MGALDSIGDFISGNSGAIGSALGTGAQLYGQQNAAQALTDANTTAANTQKQYLDTSAGYYKPYTDLGSGAAGALTKAQSGGAGGTPDYSGFMNMPGYQFAIQQGQQAAMRQAAAMGNAGNSGTSAMIGNQVAGTAMQDYNTYIDQLQKSAGLGETAANQIGNINYNTGANISQLAANSGEAMAGMYTGMGQTVGGALGAGGTYNPYSSGVSGGSGGLGGLIGGGLKAIGGWLGGGSDPASDARLNYDPNNNTINGANPFADYSMQDPYAGGFTPTDATSQIEMPDMNW